LKKKFPRLENGFPLIILEAGVNHDGNLEKAFKLIDLGVESGADFIKFQTYSANKLAANNSPSYWNLKEEPTTSQIELFSRYDGFTFEDYKSLIDHCEKNKTQFLTTCFDTDWLDLLALYLPFFKIASADITNFVLIKAIAEKGKPILLSTGASSFDEIAAALRLIRLITDAEVCLMHCVLNYPTEFQNANLSRISELKHRFPDTLIGYSDHTRSEFSHIAISLAVQLGATIIEKHFTYDKEQVGNDHYHSFDVDDVKLLYKNFAVTRDMLSFKESSFLNIQGDARTFARRGLYASRHIEKGSVIGLEDLIPLRPTVLDGGFLGSEVDLVVGKISKVAIPQGEPFTSSNLD